MFYKFMLLKYCKNAKTALDIGCANNLDFIETANNLGIFAKGIDVDSRFKSPYVSSGDFFKLKKKYDIVFTNHVLEAFDSKGQQIFIKKMSELSNDIVIIVSSYSSINFYNTPDFITPVTKIRLRWLLRRYGFRKLISIHIPFWQTVLTIGKKVRDDEFDEEAIKIREGFW